MRHALALLLAVLAGHSAASQTSYKWTGGPSGSWQTPTNWTPQGVPGAADNALFETSADVTLAADTRVNGLSATGIRDFGVFGQPPPTFPIVTVSSATHRFVSVGSASGSRGTLTITARVDTCGSAASFGSSSNNPGGQVTLQNVGGVGSVAGGGRGVSVSGSALRVGDVGVSAGNVDTGGGPTLISGTVLSVGDVTMSGSLRDGPGRLVVTSTPVPGGTRFGNFTFSYSRGTVDLQGDDVVVGRIANPVQDPTGISSMVTFSLRNADVAEIVATGTSPVGFSVGGTLRLGRAAGQGAGSLSFSATRPGAAVVFGTGASVAAPAQISRPVSVENGMNLRVDGPTLIGTGGGRVGLSGGAFTVSPGARLRLESPLFELTGTGTFGVDGELSIAPAGNNPAAPRAVTVSVPTRLAGLLDIDLSTATPGDASRISFAQLAAGGALAFTYPGGAAPYPLGTTFTPFTYTSVTGAFSPVTFPALEGNVAWAFALEPTRSRLAVVLGQAPGPVDDEVATDEDVPVSFDPAANDLSSSGGPLTTVAIGASSLGEAMLAADGTVTFTPNPNAFGDETLAYTVRGTNGLESTGTVHLVVRPVNDAPVAADDAAETQEAVVVVDVLANDTDVDGPAREIASVEDPAVGNAFESEGRVLYSPPVGFTGTVTFGYVVTDGALTDAGQVSVTVRPFSPNEPVPASVSVSAPAPNPSAGPVAVRVSLPAPARVSVDVFDARGRRVRSAAPQALGAGVHAVGLGTGLPPGAYVYRVRVEGDAAPVEAAGRFVVVR
ncbi:MAG TPA: Ig-like domain-containing protein [Rubricoccaceae bacterium]|jgi:hypothetical protein